MSGRKTTHKSNGLLGGRGEGPVSMRWAEKTSWAENFELTSEWRERARMQRSEQRAGSEVERTQPGRAWWQVRLGRCEEYNEQGEYGWRSG